MEIRNDSNLRQLAEKFKKSTNEMSNIIIQRCEDAGVFLEEQDHNERLMYFIKETTDQEELAASIFCLGVSTKEIAKIFGRLIIEKGGDCPECGEYMDEKLGGYEGNGIYQTYKVCPNCGENRILI